MRRAQVRMTLPAEVDLIALNRVLISDDPLVAFARPSLDDIAAGLRLPDDARVIHVDCDLLTWRLIVLLEGDGLPSRCEWWPGHEPFEATINGDWSIHL